jgi:hypothetical protein
MREALIANRSRRSAPFPAQRGALLAADPGDHGGDLRVGLTVGLTVGLAVGLAVGAGVDRSPAG